jgi:uncharacterized protein (DUF1684 family)
VKNLDRIRIARWAATVSCLVLLCAVSCTPTGSGRMVTEDPPDDWADSVAEYRSSKDRMFKEDPETPLLASDVPAFEGLDYWPPDPDYRFVGPIHFYTQPERFQIITTAGKLRPCEKVGWISIVHAGTVSNLQIYRLLDSDTTDGLQALFLPFADATSGTETYPAGRYVKLGLLEDGRYELDFNYAFNPSCAYGDPTRFACPSTPPENKLPGRVEAGERGYKADEVSG